MRAHESWKVVAILAVVGSLAVGGIALRSSPAPLIDCSPSTYWPTISFPASAWDEDDPSPEVSLHGELVDLRSDASSFVFTIDDADRGLLTLAGALGDFVALDLIVGSDVTVTYTQWFGTGSSGSDFELRDEDGLVLAVLDGGSTRSTSPPFVVTNVTGHCPGNDFFMAQSLLTFAAAGTVASAAAGESATISADGHDYLVHTYVAMEVLRDDIPDLGSGMSYVIARVPQ